MNCVKLVPYALLVITMASGELCQPNTISANCNLLQEIELSMDETVNPCENFYAYACNNVGLLRRSNHYQLVIHQVNLKLILTMDSLYPQPQPETTRNQSIFDKAYIYYKSCVNERDTSDLRYFELIKPGEGLEWPLLEELQAYRRGDAHFAAKAWPEDQAVDVFALLGQLQSYGLANVLIDQSIIGTASVLTLRRPQFWDVFRFSRSKLMDILSDWGLPEETALKYTQEIIDTQKYWHNLYQDYMLEPKAELFLYGRLKRQFPCLAEFLENVYLQKFPDTQRIEMHNSRYFEFLLAKQWSATEAQALCNYLMLQFLVVLRMDKVNDFSKLNCIEDVRLKLNFPVSLLYYQYVYKPDELIYNAEVNEFFNKTRLYIIEDMENHLNFSTSELRSLRAYISAISLNIGNFLRNLHTWNIEKFYENIPPLEPQNFYKNHLNLLRHFVLKSLLQFNNQSSSIIDGLFSGSSTMPFYSPKLQLLVVPLGVFQTPLYHHTYDPLFKWSFLGFELTYINTLNSVAQVLELTEVYRTDECQMQMRIDARVASYRMAYTAYVKEHGDHLQPEFSNISWKKLFFLSIHQHWCGPELPEVTYLLENGKNFESFYEAFQCPAGAKVNPTKSVYDCYTK